MKILHLNTYTQKRNLSFPHYQFHKELLSKNHQSVILSARSDLDEKEVITVDSIFKSGFLGISRYIRKIYFEIILNNKDNYFYPEWNLDRVNADKVISKVPFKPDIIIAYWTKYAFNQELLYELSKFYGAPIVYFMMDMAPLTGGCHYSFDCTNYQQECGKCPALNSSSNNDLSHKTWRFKRKFIEKTNIHYIACSSTLINQAEKSSLIKGKEVYHLMLGVDAKTFESVDRREARKLLNIEINKKIIFFGAASISERRKGLNYLVESLDKLHKAQSEKFSNEDVLLLIAGGKFQGVEIPFDYKYLGYLGNEKELALAYQSCDVFVCPSIEDSGPLMISQAIMSGRPVVSFDMGVAPDLVINNKTGYKAELGDSDDLAYGLEKVLSYSDEEWSMMSQKCRAMGVEKCSSKDTTDQLLLILEEILNKNKEVHS